MKKLILAALLLIFGISTFSQSLQIFYDGNPVAGNGTIQVVCDPATTVVTAYIACKNISTMSISTKTKKIIHAGDTLTGTNNYFCWGACFPPFVYVSPIALMIDPGATNNDFYADYEPKNIPGTSKITYVFFDENNTTDSASVTVEWKASPTGIGQELLSKIHFSDAYPNPASRIANIDYELPQGLENTSIIITNLLGAKVREIMVSHQNGRIEIPVADLENGIYFYTLRSHNGLAITKKLIVRH
jgi:hypothetical protein